MNKQDKVRYVFTRAIQMNDFSLTESMGSQLVDIGDFMFEYPDQSDPRFQDDTSRRKEYRRLQSTPNDAIPDQSSRKGGDEKIYFFPNQRMIERILRMNDATLTIAEMGVGKSGQLIRTAERYRVGEHLRPLSEKKMYDVRLEGDIRGALIIMKGESLIHNFRQDLVKLAYGNPLKRHLSKYNTSEKYKRELTKIINDFYDIRPYKSLANTLAKLTDEQIRNSFSNLLIVFDEIHTIKADEGKLKANWGEDGEEIRANQQRRRTEQAKANLTKKDSIAVDVNYQIKRLFANSQGCKYIIASATPMVNNANEIFSIFNLILPEDQQITSDFKVSAYSDEQLAQYFNGRISYVSQKDTGVDRAFAGEPIGEVYTRILGSDASSFIGYKSSVQSQAVMPVGNDMKERTISLDLVESRRKVYKVQMSTYATLHYQFTSSSSFHAQEIAVSSFAVPRIKDKAITEKGQVTPVYRRLIESYPRDISAKYYEIAAICRLRSFARSKKPIHDPVYYEQVRARLPDREPTGKIMVYDERVDKGIHIAEVYMQLAGFTRMDPKTTTVRVSVQAGREVTNTNLQPEMRYAVIDGETSAASIDKIMSLFNSPMNDDGSYISVLFGSSVLQAGVNLRGVGDVIIAGGPRNEASRNQAEARSIRLTSHEHIIAELRKTNPDARYEVNVYYVCAVPKRPKVGLLPTPLLYEEAANYYGVEPDNHYDTLTACQEEAKRRVELFNEAMTTDASLASLEEQFGQVSDLPFAGADIDAYLVSELKEQSINRVRRIMLESAYDARINATRNQRKLEQVGAQVVPISPQDDVIDKTYRLIDSADLGGELLDLIRDRLMEVRMLPIRELYAIAEEADLPEETVSNIVSNLATKPMKMKNRYGMTSYLVTKRYHGEVGFIERAPARNLPRTEQEIALLPDSIYESPLQATRTRDVTNLISLLSTNELNSLLRDIDTQLIVHDVNAYLQENEIKAIEVLRGTTLAMEPVDVPPKIRIAIQRVDDMLLSLDYIQLRRLVEAAIMDSNLFYQAAGDNTKWIAGARDELLDRLAVPEDVTQYVLNRFADYIFYTTPAELLEASTHVPKRYRTIALSTFTSPIIISYMSMFDKTRPAQEPVARLDNMAFPIRMADPSEMRGFRSVSKREYQLFRKHAQLVMKARTAAIRRLPYYGIITINDDLRIRNTIQLATGIIGRKGKLCREFNMKDLIALVLDILQSGIDPSELAPDTIDYLSPLATIIEQARKRLDKYGAAFLEMAPADLKEVVELLYTNYAPTEVASQMDANLEYLVRWTASVVKGSERDLCYIIGNYFKSRGMYIDQITL